MATGLLFTLALGGDGHLYSWGLNSNGQLGVGDQTSRDYVVAVTWSTTVPEPSGGIIEIATGDQISLALGANNVLYVWGMLSYAEPSALIVTRPIAIAWTAAAMPTGGVRHVSGGTSHVVAVGANAVAYAWGENTYGAVCDWTNANRAAPVAVVWVAVDASEPAGGVVQVAAGGRHTLLLGGDYNVYSCGSNQHGQLGNGLFTAMNHPVEVKWGIFSWPTFPGAIVQIAAGQEHSLALGVDRLIYSWGSDIYGEQGIGAPDFVYAYVYPQQVVWGNAEYPSAGVHAITAGNYFSAAVGTTDASQYLGCWGSNDYGEMGTGTQDYMWHTTAQALSGVDPSTMVGGLVSSPISDSFGVVLTSGVLLMWGDNNYGNLGDGTNQDRYSPQPVINAPVGGFSAVAVGVYHTIAVQTGGGAVYGWGYNGYGNIGDPTHTNHYSPIQVQGSTSIGQVASVYVQYYTSFALTAVGSVFAWGYDGDGGFGDGTSSTTTYGIYATTPPVSPWVVSTVATGSWHTLALVSGAVWSWGYNGYGQLGDGTYAQRDAPVAVVWSGGAVRTLVVTPPTVVQIAAGQYHSLALSADGIVYTWGNDGCGQLGDGRSSSSSYETLHPRPVVWPGGTPVVKLITAGAESTTVVTTANEVYSWGCGISNPHLASSYADSPHPVRFAGLIKGIVSNITSSSRTLCARLDIPAGSHLYVWGNNRYGMLCDAGQDPEDYPMQAPWEGTVLGLAETSPSGQHLGITTLGAMPSESPTPSISPTETPSSSLQPGSCGFGELNLISNGFFVVPSHTETPSKRRHVVETYTSEGKRVAADVEPDTKASKSSLDIFNDIEDPEMAQAAQLEQELQEMARAALHSGAITQDDTERLSRAAKKRSSVTDQWGYGNFEQWRFSQNNNMERLYYWPWFTTEGGMDACDSSGDCTEMPTFPSFAEAQPPSPSTSPSTTTGPEFAVSRNGHPGMSYSWVMYQWFSTDAQNEVDIVFDYFCQSLPTYYSWSAGGTTSSAPPPTSYPVGPPPTTTSFSPPRRRAAEASSVEVVSEVVPRSASEAEVAPEVVAEARGEAEAVDVEQAFAEAPGNMLVNPDGSSTPEDGGAAEPAESTFVDDKTLDKAARYARVVAVGSETMSSSESASLSESLTPSPSATNSESLTMSPSTTNTRTPTESPSTTPLIPLPSPTNAMDYNITGNNRCRIDVMYQLPDDWFAPSASENAWFNLVDDTPVDGAVGTWQRVSQGVPVEPYTSYLLAFRVVSADAPVNLGVAGVHACAASPSSSWSPSPSPSYTRTATQSPFPVDVGNQCYQVGATNLNLIKNGGFEMGNLKGWNVTTQRASYFGSFYITSGGQSPLSFQRIGHVPFGRFYAVSDQRTYGSYVMFQDFIVPYGVSRIAIVFYMSCNSRWPASINTTMDWRGPLQMNQHCRVDLVDPSFHDWFGANVTAGVIKNIVAPFGVYDLHADPLQFYAVDVQVTPGRAYRLAFRNVNNMYFLNHGVDEVAICWYPPPYYTYTVQTPVPSSGGASSSTSSTSVSASMSPSMSKSLSGSVSSSQSSTNTASATSGSSRSISASTSLSPSNTGTSSVTVTPSQSASGSASSSSSASASTSPTSTSSQTPSSSQTASQTPSTSVTPSTTTTASVTPSTTGSVSMTVSLTPSNTPTISNTRTPSASPSFTSSTSVSYSASKTPTSSTTATASSSKSASLSGSISFSLSVGASASQTASTTRSVSVTRFPSSTVTATESISPSTSLTPSRVASHSASVSGTISITATRSPTISTTGSNTPTISETASNTRAPLPSKTPSRSWEPMSPSSSGMDLTPAPSSSAQASRSSSGSMSFSSSESFSSSISLSLSFTSSVSLTRTATRSTSFSQTVSPSFSVTVTPTLGASQSSTETASATRSTSVSSSRSASVSITPTTSASPSGTASGTGSATPSQSLSSTAAVSATGSASKSASLSGSASGTVSPSSSQPASISSTTSISHTPSASPSASLSLTMTGTRTATPTSSASPSASSSASQASSLTQTPSVSQPSSPTQTPSTSAAGSRTQTPSASAASSGTQTPSGSRSASPSTSTTQTSTATISLTATASLSSGASASQTASTTASRSQPASATTTSTVSSTVTQTGSRTQTPTSSASASQPSSASATATGSATATVSGSAAVSTSQTATSSATGTTSTTAANSATQTATGSPTSTASTSAASTVTQTATNTATSTASTSAASSVTQTATNSATSTASTTASTSASQTVTRTTTTTGSASAASSATQTPSSSQTASQTPTATATASITATRTATSSATETPSRSLSSSLTPSTTETATASRSVSTTSTRTATKTRSLSATASTTHSGSTTETGSISTTPSATGSVSASLSATRSLSLSTSATATASGSRAASTTPTSSATASESTSLTMTSSRSRSGSASASHSASGSDTPSASPVSRTGSTSRTVSVTPTRSLTPSTSHVSATATVSRTPSATRTPVSRSASPSTTETETPTMTASTTQAAGGGGGGGGGNGGGGGGQQVSPSPVRGGNANFAVPVTPAPPTATAGSLAWLIAVAVILGACCCCAAILFALWWRRKKRKEQEEMLPDFGEPQFDDFDLQMTDQFADAFPPGETLHHNPLFVDILRGENPLYQD